MIILMILMFKSVIDINEDVSDYAKRLLLVVVEVIKKEKKTRKNIKCDVSVKPPSLRKYNDCTS